MSLQKKTTYFADPTVAKTVYLQPRATPPVQDAEIVLSEYQD